MTFLDHISLFAPMDFYALAVLCIVWLGSTWIIENSPSSRPSVSTLVASYRREWMRQMVFRDPRIFDAQIVSNLRQGTAFFASASMISIGGGLALIGNADQLTGIAEDLSFQSKPVIVWEIKVLLLLLFAVNAFLKFVWAHRLFGYCSVLMAAVPVDSNDPVALPRASKAAELNITGARSYNRGLRSVYFGIGSAAWLLGALPLLIATLLTFLVIMRREFKSHSRTVLLETTDRAADTPS